MSEIKNIIVKHYAGSHAYGTNIESSDVDFRGIFCAEKKSIITPFFNVNEKSDKSEEDTKYFELNRFMQLYLDGKPNVMETLWVIDSDIVSSTEEFELLKMHRAGLLSNKMIHNYTGFAYNMCNRMKNHNGWINKEQAAVRELNELIKSKPCVQVKEWILDTFPEFIHSQLDFSACLYYVKHLIDFDKYMRNASLQLVSLKPPKQHHFIKLVHNYFDHQVLDRDFNIMNYNSGYEMIPYGENIFGVVEKEDGKCINTSDGSIHKIDTNNRSLIDIKQVPKMIVKFNKEEWKTNSSNRNSFHDWKKNRNVARSELEVNFGYDTKNAMHTVRLLRTVEEAITTGVINVRRPDAQELLDIRNGKWTYDEVIQFFDEKSNYIRNELQNKSVLPKNPNYDLAAQVLMDIRELHWYNKK